MGPRWQSWKTAKSRSKLKAQIPKPVSLIIILYNLPACEMKGRANR